MNQFEKIGTFLFRLLAVWGVLSALRTVLLITSWGLGEWLFLAGAILLFVFSIPLGRLVGRDLG